MLFRGIPILLLLIVVSTVHGFSQCSELGQRPQTAFPVCGSAVFKQESVPTCLNGNILVQGCTGDGALYSDLNPYWYKFTCFKAGTLVFSIAPNSIYDDYDWTIFDVTGRDVSVVYTTDPATMKAIFVAANWSARSGPPTNGVTGTSTNARNYSECASIPGVSDPEPLSRAPNLIEGHNYLLMISHFSGDGQSGYGLSFGGGTASITDTVPPKMQALNVNCSGTKIGIKLNKKMRCSSLQSNGGDFSISPANATVTNATAKACAVGFDMDSIVLTLSNPLPDGHYEVVAKNGSSDGNTLEDICLNQVPLGDTLPFEIAKPKPVKLDSIMPATCAADVLTLFVNRKVLCSSIAADGSDFSISGPVPVNIIRAYGDCDADGLSQVVHLKLNHPLYDSGSYSIKLTKVVIDECNLQTGQDTPLVVTVKDTVSAAFNAQLMLGCKLDSLVLSHDGAHGVTSWQWLFDDNALYTTKALTRRYASYGTRTVRLDVSNGFCTDTSAVQSFIMDNRLKAQFNLPTELCPQDKAIFTDSSIGSITSWAWAFGNGNTSNEQNPPGQLYPTVDHDKFFPVQLIVQNNLQCYDTAYTQLKVLYNCYIAVPTGFTPNGDGLNDYLYPMNAYKARNLEFKVYNRWGQQVFETRDWTRKWDGTINGNPQAPGVYAWYLSYTHADTGKQYFLKGTTVLIR